MASDVPGTLRQAALRTSEPRCLLEVNRLLTGRGDRLDLEPK